MGYLIQWDNAEKTVVLQQYTGMPIKDDLYHLAEESANMLKSVPHTVHLIIDQSLIKLNLNAADINYLEKNVPSNQGAVVMIVKKNDLNYKRLMQTIGQKMAPKSFGHPYFAASIEEARQLLQELFEIHYPESTRS